MAKDQIHWLIGLVILFLLPIAYWRGIFRVRRVFGCMPWSTMRQMLLFTCYTLRGVLICVSIAGVLLSTVALVSLGYTTGIWIWEIWLWIFVITASQILFDARPPAVVLLTSSSPQNAELFRIVRQAISPMRCVALLNYRYLSPLQLLDCFQDNLRTRNGKIWKSIVHQLIEIAPVVVVDARPETGPVAEEVFMMLAPERAGKALFLIGANGECPALKSNGIDPMQRALKTATEESLVQTLDEMLEERLALKSRRAEAGRVSPPVVPEDWNHLPSVLFVQLTDCFDSRELIRIVSTSNKDLIVHLMPLTRLDNGRGGKIPALTWEFVYEPKLAMILFKQIDIVLIRKSFLLQHAPALPHYEASSPWRNLTWEDLNRPDPVVVSAIAFFQALVEEARQHGFSCRYLET